MGSVLAAFKDPAKGEGTNQVVVNYDAKDGNVSVNAAQPITSISLESASGVFMGDAAANLGGPFDVDTDVKVFKAVFGSDFSEVDFGTVARRIGQRLCARRPDRKRIPGRRRRDVRSGRPAELHPRTVLCGLTRARRVGLNRLRIEAPLERVAQAQGRSRPFPRSGLRPVLQSGCAARKSTPRQPRSRGSPRKGCHTVPTRPKGRA